MKRYYCYDRLKGDWIRLGKSQEKQAGTKLFWKELLGSMSDSNYYTLVEEPYIRVGVILN